MKLVGIAMLSLFCAASVSAQQPTPVKVGHGLNPSSHMGSAGAAFAETLNAKAPGKYKVELFPSFALGDERQMVEGAILGNIDVVITSTGPLGNFVPDFMVLDMPFLFRDYAHARKVLDGPIGEKLLEKCAPKGFVCLAWSENGFRHLTNSKRPVATPEDLKGLKVRTMENDVHMQAFKTMGAMPTPISGAEIYSALQQHTVDGAENPLGNIGLQKLQQVQKYLTLSGHFYSPAVVVMSGALWAKATPAERAAFKDAARAAATAARKKVDEQDIQWLADLKAAGMTVTTLTPDQRAAFVKAVQPAYAQWEKQYGDTIKAIRAVQ